MGVVTNNTNSIQTWHILDTDSVVERLQVDLQQGLSPSAVEQRLHTDGYNEIIEGKHRSPLSIFAQQFSDFMILVLIAAAVISGIIGEPEDAIAIVVIVSLNAIVGAIQEYKAEKAIAALKLMAAPEARVLRGGEMINIPAREIITSDLVYLEAGDVVPADLRLIESEGLELDEAALTGESLAVSKLTEPQTDQQAVLGDRNNMAYKGTLVTRGRGLGITTATGMHTELGKIASLLREQKDIKTPLQRRLAKFGQRLALVVLAICALIFIAGLLRDEPVLLMFLTAVSLAVAAIPEALPAVITMSLALGARKMSRRQSLVRNLPAVETLGSVTFICSDKTGTLTQNKMVVERILVAGQELSEIPPESPTNSVYTKLGQALALNNDIVISRNQASDAKGEPTELALFQAALHGGFDKTALEQQLPRINAIPFDAERKRMTTLHQDEQKVIAFCKGAPESVLVLCTQQLGDQGIEGLDQNELLQQAETLANQGYRVLAVAFREFDTVPSPLDDTNVETGLTLLGLVALLDPPRPEANAAVQECLSAGITPVMITGDHPGTAMAIASRLGIADDNEKVITGDILSAMSLADFEQRVESIRVYARVNPTQKTKIVKALQDRGQYVAMTGDGVNDAPALKSANIGVAMGLKGTDVAREASDMVLLDDNFATIVSAVREGRRIFDNIRKFIKYTMTSNTGEVWTLFMAPFLGLPIPLLPIHILWINLVTDGLPGLALSFEPAEKGIMQRAPRRPDESIFSGGMWQHMLWVGALIGSVSILSQAWAIHNDSDSWQTIVFTVLTFSQLVHALVIRSEKSSLLSLGLFSNRYLLAAVLITVALQLAVIYLPFLNDIFKTQPLTATELGFCFLLPVSVFVAVETEKWFKRRN